MTEENNEDQTSDNHQGELQPGSLFANRFEVLSRIAAGGMGVVYRVKDTALGGEEVALKLLHPQYSENKIVLKRFLNEVRVARALSHPHIVRIHDFGTADNGQAFITMEYVAGQSLSKLIASIFPEDQADNQQVQLSEKTFKTLVQIYQQILEAISYAHKRGIIHRDLKPANILIGSAGDVKVADFGTARILGNSSTITVEGQSSLGTPQYMSPEQVRGETLDKSCDIYALGMLGYELVVGHPPFYGIAPLSVMYKQLNETIPPFADESKGIPVWWQTVVLQATEKDKKARFSDVEGMLEIILEHTGNVRSYVANPQTIEGLRIHVKQKTPLIMWAALVLGSFLILMYLLTNQSKENTISIPYLPPPLPTSAPIDTQPTVITTLPTSNLASSSGKVTEPPSSVTESLPTAVPTKVPRVAAVQPAPENYMPRPVSRADYQGTFSRAITGDTSAPDKVVKLSLSFSDDKVQGKASFDGKENFDVTGIKNLQGMQLTLKSSSKIIQMSGAFRSDGYLRGSYYLPLTNSRGTWLVKQQ